MQDGLAEQKAFDERRRMPRKRSEPIEIRFVPMAAPADEPAIRRQFRVSVGYTLRELREELAKVEAQNVTIQAGFRGNAIRNDGMPYADAKVTHRGVCVQFQHGVSGAPFVMRATKYSRYEDNLRAIVLTLRALRACSRYGIVDGQQYTGFRQLEAGPVTREDKIAHLAEHGATPGEREAARRALRRLN